MRPSILKPYKKPWLVSVRETLRASFKNLWASLRGHWQIWLSVVILLLSFSQVALASSGSRAGSDCWRVMSSCDFPIDDEKSAGKDIKTANALAAVSFGQQVTYRLDFQGELEESTDTVEFAAQVKQTLNDARGWLRAGYAFARVNTGGDFTLVLIQAELLNNVPGCDSNWSCRSGRNVFINEDRWNGATAAWNGAGGGLRDYRHMVVNHEVGHWLGHGHYNCSQGENGKAPVMQQQSISLQGCKFNPWPLEFEIDTAS